MIAKTIKPITEELSKKDVFKIPTVLKNKVLMSPGKWNGNHYTSEQIRLAFENTDWSDKDNISLILDHADKPLSVHDWVGWIKSPRMNGENVIGDLEIYDENVLVKLMSAKAKFGISPRVRGIESEDEEFTHFTFENFSIVTNPAVKKAYINLSESNLNEQKGGKMVTKKELQDETGVEEETTEKETTEETAEVAEPKEEVKEMAKKKMIPKNKKKKDDEDEDEEELSENSLLELATDPAWGKFAKEMKDKNSKLSLKNIALAFNKRGKEMDELSVKTDSDLLALSNKIGFILRNRKLAEEGDAEEEVPEAVKEMRNEIKELRQRLDAPDSKSVQELSDSGVSSGIFDAQEKHHTNGSLAMAEYLRNQFG